MISRQSNLEMSQHDREKRHQAQTDKKKKLQNPLFFVSPTRYTHYPFNRHMM